MSIVMYNVHSHLLILTVASLNGIDEALCICFVPLMVLMKI
jgi:hypothetical protein